MSDVYIRLSDAANSDFGKPTNTDDSIDLETELVCDPLSMSFEGELAGDTHMQACQKL